jgi:hypothetical protein
MPIAFETSFVAESRAVFRQFKSLAERAIAQIPDEDLWRELDGESNSIALIMKHMAGNMRSRWTDFLTTDGEKPWRRRDDEFVAPLQSREALLADWEDGWAVAFATFDALGDQDMDRVVTIRGERHSVMQALLRQNAHYAYHVGQIVYLAKHFKGADFRSLSIPKTKP